MNPLQTVKPLLVRVHIRLRKPKADLETGDAASILLAQRTEPRDQVIALGRVGDAEFVLGVEYVGCFFAYLLAGLEKCCTFQYSSFRNLETKVGEQDISIYLVPQLSCEAEERSWAHVGSQNVLLLQAERPCATTERNEAGWMFMIRGGTVPFRYEK